MFCFFKNHNPKHSSANFGSSHLVMFFLPICVILTRSAQPAGFGAKGFAQKRALCALLGLLSRLSLPWASVFPQDFYCQTHMLSSVIDSPQAWPKHQVSFQEDAGIDVRQSTPAVCFFSQKERHFWRWMCWTEIGPDLDIIFFLSVFWNVQSKDGMDCVACSLWPSQSLYSRHCSFQRKTGCRSLLSNRPLSVSAWFLLLIPTSHKPAAAEGALSYPSFSATLCVICFSLFR